MPIVNEPDGPDPKPVPAPIQVSGPAYRGVTVDTRYTPLSSLITAIEGSPWSVNYYSQVINPDNQVDAQQIGRPAAYQAYDLIQQLELKVITDLQYSQDEEPKVNNYSGEALVYPFLIPNKGDMFLADVGDGREGVFTVTSIEPKSLHVQTVYAIKYEMVDWSTTQRRADLTAKVQNTYQYVKDFLMYGQNPLVLAGDYATVLSLQEAYPRTIRAWSQEFFSPEFATWMIPGQVNPTYDSFLVKSMFEWFTYDDAPEMMRARAFSVAGDEQMTIPTIWDVLMTGDVQLMRRITEQVGTVSVNIFTPDPMLEGIRYTGVSYVLYPLDPITTWDEDRKVSIPALAMAGVLREAPVRRARIADLIPEHDLTGLPYEGLPLIKPVTVDNFYVLSQAFYTRDNLNMSRLERAVWDYLLNNSINLDLLNVLLQSYQSWGGLERYYYTPLIALLLKARLRSI